MGEWAPPSSPDRFSVRVHAEGAGENGPHLSCAEGAGENYGMAEGVEGKVWGVRGVEVPPSHATGAEVLSGTQPTAPTKGGWH